MTRQHSVARCSVESDLKQSSTLQKTTVISGLNMCYLLLPFPARKKNVLNCPLDRLCLCDAGGLNERDHYAHVRLHLLLL